MQAVPVATSNRFFGKILVQLRDSLNEETGTFTQNIIEFECNRTEEIENNDNVTPPVKERATGLNFGMTRPIWGSHCKRESLKSTNIYLAV